MGTRGRVREDGLRCRLHVLEMEERRADIESQLRWEEGLDRAVGHIVGQEPDSVRKVVREILAMGGGGSWLQELQRRSAVRWSLEVSNCAVA